MNSLRFLLPFLRPYRGQVIAGVAAILLAVVIGLATPLLVGQAVDTLKQELAPRTLLIYGAWVVGIAAVRGVFLFAQRRVLVAVSRNVEQDLRDLYFRHLTTLTPAYFSHHPTGDLMARATNDLSAVRMVCGPAIMYVSNTVFTSLGGLSLMAWIHPRLTLASLVILPFVALATKVIGARIHVLFESVQENFSALTSRVQENLAGVRVVRAYAQEEGEEQRFDALNREAFERNRRLARWNAAFDPLLQALVGLGFVAVLWYGGFLVQRGELSVGGFVTFNLFLSKMIWPMIAIGYVSNLVQRGSASLARIREVLAAVPEIVECPEPRLPAGGVIRGQVTVQGLTFRYAAAGPPAVRGVSFEVPAGARVALVGRTGAGKSTLLQLLPRAYDPPPGTVFVDGVDVLQLPLAALRAAIGVVPQESFLFSATVAENITFGRPEATAEEVAAAAAAAGLDADLAGFPRGLETLVGERGITLSGGQKQRVALARALVRQPRILVLDDSLSAVDTHTEELILANLERHFQARTVFLVSHRISTVRGADLILVLDGGQVVERGTHDELLALGGLYADLHERQQLEAELEEVE